MFVSGWVFIYLWFFLFPFFFLPLFFFWCALNVNFHVTNVVKLNEAEKTKHKTVFKTIMSGVRRHGAGRAKPPLQCDAVPLDGAEMIVHHLVLLSPLHHKNRQQLPYAATSMELRQCALYT